MAPFPPGSWCASCSRILADEAESLDAVWAFERLHRLAQQGTSADRQVALARAGQPLEAVLAAVANETAA